MSATATKPTYVYGVISANAEPPQTAGIGGAPLREITSDGIKAVVSDLEGEQGLAFGREEMLAHERVLEKALQHSTVLPMRFGVVMEDETAVKDRLLDAHHAELEQQLQELSDKVELRIRAMYEEDAVMREVLAEDKDILRLRESLRGAPEDATYYKRIQLGEMVANAVQRKRDVDASTMLESLSPFALATQLGEPLNERMVLNASFLVDRERMSAFDETIETIGRQQANRMRIKYTGPLPPHSFVKLETEA